MPVRTRLVVRTRRIAFAGLLVVVSLALGLSWAVARSIASSSTFWLDVVHAVAFAGLALLAWVLARRSTRVIEELFEQEDRLMLAVVHEGNRPLSRLVVAIDEGLSGAVTAESALKEVSVHTDALRELIDALLETARVATGAISLADEAVRLDEVARHLERHGEAQLATVVLDTRPVVVVGSPRLLLLAMTNLVRNAAQHAYHGGPGEIGLRVDARGVTITDDGPGLDVAKFADLRRHETWLGLRLVQVRLGLPLSGWVAEIHGGALGLANRAGGGFEARLELPTRPVLPTGELARGDQ